MCLNKNNKKDDYDYTDGFLVHDDDNNNNNNRKKKIKNIKKKIKNIKKKINNKKHVRKNTVQFEKTSMENIHTLQDIITLCKEYQSFLNTYNQKAKRIFILDRLLLTIDSLIQLNNMIGLSSIKTTVKNQLLYIIQGLNNISDFNHICLYGNPGCGKTYLSHILADIFRKIGILTKGNVIKATRSDLIGGYLGSTAIKTAELLQSCKGNVLILDEVYSLGSADTTGNGQKDSFAKECIDTINSFLSEERHNFICIICGYKEDVKNCFFSYNKGLERRFPWIYELDVYTITDIKNIFIKQIIDTQWTLSNDTETSVILDTVLFKKGNEPYFSNYGGDTEVLLTKCKIAHSQRLFLTIFQNNTTADNKKKQLNSIDIKKGYDEFLKNKETSTNNNKKNTPPPSSSISMMYL